MQSNLEALGQLERRLTMAVPVADIDKQVDERLKQLARTVRMAGFRPGKVPLKLVAQQYGPQVRSEVIGNAVEKSFSAAVRDQNLRVAGYPRIERKDAPGEDRLEFSATFEVYPEVQLSDVSSVSIERSTLTVTDAEVEKTIASAAQQRTRYEAAYRAAAQGDRATIDFTGTIDGVEFDGGKGTDFAFVLGEGRMLPDFEAGVTGMKPGESRVFPVAFPADYQGRDVAGKTANFAVTAQGGRGAAAAGGRCQFARPGDRDGDLGKMRAEVKANVDAR
jgi:trigger factor